MASALYYLGSLLCAPAAAINFRQSRRQPNNPGNLWLTAGLLCPTLAMTLSAPATLALLGTNLPAANAVRLLGNALSMAGTVCAHAMVLHLERPRAEATVQVRHQLIIFAGTIATMAILLVIARPRVTDDFSPAFNSSTPILLYFVAFASYPTWSLTAFVQLMGRYQRDQHVDPVLRVAVRFMVTGVAFGIAWTAWRLLTTVVAQLGAEVTMQANYSSALALISGYLALAFSIFVALGTTWSIWYPPLQHWLAYIRLAPLLSALEHPRSHAASTARAQHTDDDWQQRLHRRVIQIHDALLPLKIATKADKPDQLDPQFDNSTSELTACLEKLAELHQDQHAQAPRARPNILQRCNRQAAIGVGLVLSACLPSGTSISTAHSNTSHNGLLKEAKILASSYLSVYRSSQARRKPKS